MSLTNPKVMIINFLNGNISVVDDSAGAIAGKVAGTWYDAKILGTDKWMITVGPTINSTMRPDDIGAINWRMRNILVVNIWVPILENQDYTPERLRFSLKEEVKRLLMAQLVDPAADIKYLHLSNWRDLDDRENDILRIECTVEIEWQE